MTNEEFNKLEVICKDHVKFKSLKVTKTVKTRAERSGMSSRTVTNVSAFPNSVGLSPKKCFDQ